MKILAVTDYSTCASNAVNYAANLAVQLKAQLTVYHCFQLPVAVAESPYTVLASYEPDEQMHARINNEAEQLNKKFTSIKINGVLEVGLPADAIINYATDYDYDLIVMGIRGINAVEKFFVGSTTITITNDADIPVLVIPEGFGFTAINSLVMACDYNEFINKPNLEFIKSITDKFYAHIYLLNIFKKQHLPSIKEASALLKLDNYFGEEKHSYHFIEDENVERGIQTFLSTYKSDWLVMVKKHLTFFQKMFVHSHTREMIYNTKIPLLVLHY